MPTQSPYRIEPSDDEHTILEERARAHTAPYWEVVRARIVLLASEGFPNKDIARRLDTTPQTVCKWRKRFYEEGLGGLEDRPCSGRPRPFPPSVRVEVKALACELPATSGVPLSRWSAAEVAREAMERGFVASISGTTVWRWLSEDAIRSFYHRSWIFPRDPDFAHKASRVLDLYEGRWEGEPLGEGEYVISADEKTSIQARMRCHPTLPATTDTPMRVEHGYERKGALAYLAAFDVHGARLFGRCESKNGIEPFGRLVERVMREEPYASADRVFWIVDNGSSHRGERSVKRLEGEWPNLRLIHLPTHASWLNQIEIYFSVVQRKVLTPNDFADLEILAEHLIAFQQRYEQAAEPFAWKFTRHDLDRLLSPGRTWAASLLIRRCMTVRSVKEIPNGTTKRLRQ